jgi:sigma-B regulation protein RsbU (phosphoserine phosphatase)
MSADTRKTKSELIGELVQLRRQAEQAKRLRQQLRKLRAEHRQLETHCDAHVRTLRRECRLRDRTEEALRLAEVIIERSPAVLFRRLSGAHPRLVYVSSNIRRFGYSADDFISGKIQFQQIVHPEDRERLVEEINSFAKADAEEYTQSYRVLTRDGNVRWVDDQTSVIRDPEGRKIYNQGIMVDVTDRRRAEEELRRSEEKWRRIIETAGLGFLLMDEALRIVDVNAAYCSMLGYRREELLGKTPFDLADEGFRRFMAVNRRKILASDYRKFEGTLIAKGGRKVPVLIHGYTLRSADGGKIGNASFVADLTEQKKALELAGKVQKSLTPARAPVIAGLDIAGRSDPCEEVGGDYFDFLYGPEYPAGTLRVVVGDMSGHGVDAALLMTTARAFTRMRAGQPGGPSQVVASINRDLAADMGDSGSFMTLFYMEIDPLRKTARWVRAGHEPALVYCPRRRSFEELAGGGIPLGVDTWHQFSEQHLDVLHPGTVLALGTDGIWEAHDPEGRVFGKQRFRDAVRRASEQPARDIVARVFDEVYRFSRGMPYQDDVTLVVIKIEQ